MQMEKNETVHAMRERYMSEYWDSYNSFNNMPHGVQLKYYKEYEFRWNNLLTMVDILDRVLRVQGYYYEQ